MLEEYIRGQDPLWRYMEYWKFENLIESNTLYFCRLDKLPDIREGYMSLPSIENDNRILSLLGLQDLQDTVSTIMGEKFRKTCFVNCWNKDISISDIMWAKYPLSTVAIKTTVAALKESIQFESTIDHYKKTPGPRVYRHQVLDKIQIGDVRYIEHDNMYSNSPLTMDCFHKEKDDFSFENEYRVCVRAWKSSNEQNNNDYLDFISIPVKLDILIKDVFIRSSLFQEQQTKVDNLLRKTGLLINAKQSPTCR